MKHYKRGFLNKGEGMAAFEADIVHEEFEGCDRKYIHANFAITDCNRKISLDFCSSNKADELNAVHKLNTLIAELEEFRQKMIAAYEWAYYKHEEK